MVRDATTLLHKFSGVKPKPGGGWMARCPAHEDRQQSLSIDAKNNKVLLKCFAQCDASAIAAAVGLTLSDLFLDDSAAPARPRAVTTESLAASKGLPVEILRRYGVKDCANLSPAERLAHGVQGNDGVWIPYFNADGSIAARSRLRTAHIAKDGSRWLGQFGAVQPYGLHDLADAKTEGVLVLCEGETDYWSLRAMGVPALALPGAQMVKTLQRGHLAGVHALYVCQDSDAAGASFVALVRQAVAPWGVATVAAVPMPTGCKDVNDFYRLAPATAAERFTGLLQAAAASSAPAVREFSTAGEIYTLTAPEWGLTLELDQIRRSWGDLSGELAITGDSLGDVARGTVNLSSMDKRHAFAASLAKRPGLKDIDWGALIEDFAIRCLKAEREGKPGVWLDEVAPRPADMCVTVSGFEVPLDLPACLFGDGDTGKSFLALHVLGELARRGIKCGIVDAEMEDSIHAERLGALFGGAKPRIAHIRLDRPLALSVDQVRRFVRDKGLRYLVYDSVGFLTPEPEKSESALSYMRAVRQVGTGSLSIAHVTKQQEVKPEQQKPFGSNFYYQSFRRIWYAQAESEPDADGRKVIGIWDRKANTARKRPPFGLALTVRDGYAHVELAELSQSDELGAKLPTGRRIEAALQRGALSAEALAEGLELTPNAVRIALSRAKKAGRVVQLDGARGDLWGLGNAA